jgi:hypothetical protein
MTRKVYFANYLQFRSISTHDMCFIIFSASPFFHFGANASYKFRKSESPWTFTTSRASLSVFSDSGSRFNKLRLM